MCMVDRYQSCRDWQATHKAALAAFEKVASLIQSGAEPSPEQMDDALELRLTAREKLTSWGRTSSPGHRSPTIRSRPVVFRGAQIERCCARPYRSGNACLRESAVQNPSSANQATLLGTTVPLHNGFTMTMETE
jgi:hypothetical protein